MFFSNSNACLYVGKNSSQSFIERIPWHFALSEKSWMSHFLKHFRNHRQLDSIPEAALNVLDCRLLLIPVERIRYIDALEKLMKLVMKPEFNSYSERYMSQYRQIDYQGSFRLALKRVYRSA